MEEAKKRVPPLIGRGLYPKKTTFHLLIIDLATFMIFCLFCYGELENQFISFTWSQFVADIIVLLAVMSVCYTKTFHESFHNVR